MKSIIARAVNSKEFKNTKSMALLEMVFDDLVTLLKFVHQGQKEGLLNGPFLFTNQIDYLDSVWHQFILHTRLYHDFCMQEFGEYLHHEPENLSELSKKKNSRNLEEDLAQQMEVLEKYLGADFVNRIFFIYPELLPKEL